MRYGSDMQMKSSGSYDGCQIVEMCANTSHQQIARMITDKRVASTVVVSVIYTSRVQDQFSAKLLGRNNKTSQLNRHY